MRQTPETTTPDKHQVPTPGAGIARWRPALGFLTGIVLLFGVTILIFSGTGRATGQVTAAGTYSGTATGKVTKVGSTPEVSVTRKAQVVAASTHNYALTQANPGVMQPSVDRAGNIWFGEMFANSLARLNPMTGSISTWIPPHGQDSIMATAIDRVGNVWFTEQAANYIGRFDPTTDVFTTYDLNQADGHSSAPQDLKFDSFGNLWFTEVNGAQIGRLNPATGAIVTWQVPSPTPGTPSLPFCLTVTRSGQVWFGYLSGGTVGELDPNTGAVRLYHLASSQTEVYAMNIDRSGIVWFSELEGGNLGRIDTLTGGVTEIPVPATNGAGSADGMYDLQVAGDGDVWIAIAGANSLVRYAPQTGGFTFYQLQIPDSIPFGLTFDGTGNVWFTASTNPNYVGVLSQA